MNYHLRLSKPYSILETFFRQLQCDLVVYEHQADDEIKRTHVHALIKGSPVKATTMKARLTKLCGVWKKEDWAFMTHYGSERTLIDDDLITYMSKGILDPVLVVGFIEEYLLDQRSKWVEPKRDKPTKPTYDSICKQIQSMTIAKATPLEILHNTLDVLQKHNVVCGRYKIRDIVDTVYRRQSRDMFVNDMVAMLPFPKIKSYD